MPNEENKQTHNKQANTAMIQRLIGIVVLIAAGIILWPILFPASEDRTVITQTLDIPEKPVVNTFSPDEETSLENQPLPVENTIKTESEANANNDKPVRETDSGGTIKTVASGEIIRESGGVTDQAVPSGNAATNDPPPEQQKPVEPAEAIVVTTPQHASAWLLQIGNFTSQENANRMILKAQQEGFRVYSRTEKDSEGKLHTKVLVGPKLDRDNAEKQKEEIEKKLGLKSFLVEFRPGDQFFKVNLND